MTYYLGADTETGSLSPSTGDLLTAAFVLYNGKFEEMWAFEFGISLNYYRTTPEALAINKLDLDHLKRTGLIESRRPATLPLTMTPEQALSQSNLLTMLEYLALLRKDKVEVVTMCHNTPFDMPFLKEWFPCIFGTGSNDSLVSYRTIDTIGFAFGCKDAGLLNTKNLKLETLSAHFGIEHDAHSALSDARTCFEVYRRLVDLCKS